MWCGNYIKKSIYYNWIFIWKLFWWSLSWKWPVDLWMAIILPLSLFEKWRRQGWFIKCSVSGNLEKVLYISLLIYTTVVHCGIWSLGDLLNSLLFLCFYFLSLIISSFLGKILIDNKINHERYFYWWYLSWFSQFIWPKWAYLSSYFRIISHNIPDMAHK